MSPDRNQTLIDYFKDRTVWTLTVDRETYHLERVRDAVHGPARTGVYLPNTALER
jgi:hypothetical protein